MTQPLSTEHAFGEFSEEQRGTRLKAWRPKKWRPEYERMVAMSCLGMSNKMIAQEVNYTKEHVSTILNMEEAEVIRMMVLEKMRNNLVEVDIPKRLNSIAEKTVVLLEKSFDNDELRQKSPFALIDRGLDVMKGIGHLKGGGNGSGNSYTINNQGNGVVNVITPEVADSLAEALRRSDQVKQLHEGNGKEIIIQTAESVEVK